MPLPLDANTKREAIEQASSRVKGPFTIGGGHDKQWGYKVWSPNHNAWWMHTTGWTYQQAQRKVSIAKAKLAVHAYLDDEQLRDLRIDEYPGQTAAQVIERAALDAPSGSTLTKMNAILETLDF